MVCSVMFLFNAQVVAPELLLQGMFSKQGFLACHVYVNQAFYFSVGGSSCRDRWRALVSMVMNFGVP